MSNEIEERPGVPKLVIVATLFFVAGMVLIVLGMIGTVPVVVQQIGSVLALIAVVLRIVGRAKLPRRERDDAARPADSPPRQPRSGDR